MASTEDRFGLVGTVVADKYVVERQVGEGGFGVVYRAQHKIWDQPVAIKCFTALSNAPREYRDQLLDLFVQEGKLLSSLSSRTAAIVQARDIGTLTTPTGVWLPYMVLEWLDGTPLDVIDRTERRRGLSPRTLPAVLRLLDDAAKGLDMAHKSGIAHRDLKPGNIMVMGDPRSDAITVKLLDFGIAKVMEKAEGAQDTALTGQAVTAFTPDHGAPEQFSRSYGATGPWTDVYAMALIMVELMSADGKALEGESFYELGVSSCSPQRRPTPRTLGIEVSNDVEAIFAKALSIHPGDRYATMGDLFRALHHAVFPGQDTWRSGTTVAPTPNPLSLPPAAARSGGAHSESMGPVTGIAATPAPRTSRAILALAAVVGLGALGLGAFLLGKRSSAPEASADDAVDASLSASATPAAALPAPTGPCLDGMKVVPGGAFRMGSDEPDFPLWKPAHDVELDTFCLDVHEVTVERYAACVAAGACTPAATTPRYPTPKGYSEADQQKEIAAFAEFCNAGKAGREQHPINCVDWHQADAFCKHVGGRLPTEAEWELAARGSDGRKFPWGNDTGNETYMNAAGGEWRTWRESHGLTPPQGLMFEAEDGYAGTAPIGRYPRAQTQTGQMDMVGNVWEWTADWYDLYDQAPARNPKGPAAGNKKAIRGGGFNGEFAIWMRPAARYHQVPDAAVHAIGFRCAADVRQAQ
ncbi:MAG: SUMF1/EgtB/PvdO family nonheme iron enzyme [Myxococcales bacterium]|nr:SUMF1/EgtB/PvdO family nonheme iron enzyme [Myxococcales bacterium]